MGKRNVKNNKTDETVESDLAITEQPLQNDIQTKQKWYARHWHWILAHRLISSITAAVLVLATLAIVPHTRYAALGLFIKQSFSIVVVDAETNKPVSEAQIDLNGKKVLTDNTGRATVRTAVGFGTIEVSKKYYNSLQRKVIVPVAEPEPLHLTLKAKGRPVPITVSNRISKQPIANVLVAAEGTEVKTDATGKAIIVLPADKKEVTTKLSGDGFNATEATLTVTTDEVSANTFELTPSGKIYFLSNASGKIDLIKSNLDGTERQTVLAGTGKEDRYNTILLASRDWKYIALLSRRDGGDYAKLFLIETANGDKMTTMDEGEATFSVYGWSDDRFVYVVNRAKKKEWEPGRYALKSYSATAKKITTITETAAQGDQNNYAYEYLGDQNVYVLGEEIAFIKNWSGGCSYHYYHCNSLPRATEGKQATFNTVRADGSQKKVVKSYSTQWLQTKAAEFGEIYILYEDSNKNKVDGYHSGKLTADDQTTEQEFNNEPYPYYSVSPSGNKTLWSNYIDGKNTFFVGDATGKDGKEIGRTEDFSVYGWFTDDYLLLTKKGSEMRIIPAGGIGGDLEKSLKISDYYKPSYQNRGFGYGYGG